MSTQTNVDYWKLTRKNLGRLSWVLAGLAVASTFWVLTGEYGRVRMPFQMWQMWTLLPPIGWLIAGASFLGWTWGWNQMGVVRTQRWWKANNTAWLKAETRAKIQRLEYERDHYRERFQESANLAAEYRRALRAVDAARQSAVEDEVATARMFR